MKDPADIARIVETVVRELGGIDILVNNAGVTHKNQSLMHVSEEDFDRIYAVNVKSIYLTTLAVVPVMERRGGGSIINTGSIAGLSGGWGPHIYSAAKAAVIHLTKSVALELGVERIRANAICPGGILTPLAATNFGKGEEGYRRAQEGLAKWQPIPRAGMPDDIAQMALFLASDESTFVTGQAISVDGGIMAGRDWQGLPEVLKKHRPMRVPGQARAKG